MHSDRLVEHLREFGLSQKEAAIFEAVLDMGEAKPSEIASAANVSTRYAYEVGERLERRGLVSVYDHLTPTVIRPREPDEIIAKFQDELSELQPALEKRFTHVDRNIADIEIIKTCSTLRKRMKEAISAATREIALCVPHTVLQDLENVLREAKQRGVFILLVTDTADISAEHGAIADILRVNSTQSTALLVIDRTSVIVMEQSMLTTATGDEWALACYGSELSELLYSGFIHRIWDQATLEYVVEPVSLPSTFSNFSAAVVHATLHLNNGEQLFIEVNGRDPKSEESTRTITGEITAVDQPFLPLNGSNPTPRQAIRIQQDGRECTIGEGSTNADFAPTSVTLYAE